MAPKMPTTDQTRLVLSANATVYVPGVGEITRHKPSTITAAQSHPAWFPGGQTQIAGFRTEDADGNVMYVQGRDVLDYQPVA